MANESIVSPSLSDITVVEMTEKQTELKVKLPSNVQESGTQTTPPLTDSGQNVKKSKLGSCSVQTLSRLVALLHIWGCFAAIVAVICWTADEEKSGMDVIIIKSWYLIPLTILFKSLDLLKGIREKNEQLISSFMGTMSLLILFFFFWAIVDFFMGLINGHGFDTVLMELFIDFTIIVVGIVILRPVRSLQKELKDTKNKEFHSQIQEAGKDKSYVRSDTV